MTPRQVRAVVYAGMVILVAIDWKMSIAPALFLCLMDYVEG